jgi:ABC-type antimicrobial peptide transport system permease subunit
MDLHSGVKGSIFAPALSQAVAAIDSNLPVYFGGTPARLHDEILGVNRITATLFTIFGIAAVVLSAVGLYGVMSFSVNQRTQEFGIRMALGADGAQILRMVMTQGAWQLAIGLFIGVSVTALLLNLIGTEALRNFLFRVNLSDTLWVYSAVAGVLSAVAAASVFVPARRATRVNPIIALRAE